LGGWGGKGIFAGGCWEKGRRREAEEGSGEGGGGKEKGRGEEEEKKNWAENLWLGI